VIGTQTANRKNPDDVNLTTTSGLPAFVLDCAPPCLRH
jgi:hypothetical protein